MAPTLRVDDKIRTRLGSQLNYINSAYRSPAYNAKCPGAASRSYHMQNCALDLMFDCGSETAFAMAKRCDPKEFSGAGSVTALLSTSTLAVTTPRGVRPESVIFSKNSLEIGAPVEYSNL